MRSRSGGWLLLAGVLIGVLAAWQFGVLDAAAAVLEAMTP